MKRQPSDEPKRKPLAGRLKAGLREGIAYAQGKMDLRTTQLPERPPKFSAKKVIRLRESTGMSQAFLRPASQRFAQDYPKLGTRPARPLPSRPANAARFP